MDDPFFTDSKYQQHAHTVARLRQVNSAGAPGQSRPVSPIAAAMTNSAPTITQAMQSGTNAVKQLAKTFAQASLSVDDVADAFAYAAQTTSGGVSSRSEERLVKAIQRFNTPHPAPEPQPAALPDFSTNRSTRVKRTIST
jgi:hypothetical protein